MEIFTADFWKGIFSDFMEFLTELPIKALKGILDAVLAVFNSITPPDFLSHYQLGSALGPVMSYIGFFMAQAGIGEAMSLIATAVAFRVIRKVVTFGLW